MILRYSEILEQIEHAKKKSFHSLIQTYSLSRSFLYFIEKLPLTLMGLYFNSKKNNHWSTQESKKILQLLNELVLLIKKDSDRISNGIYPNDVLRPELSNQMVLGSVKLWIKGLVQIVKTSKHRGANSKFSNSKYVNLNLLFSEDEPANIKNLKLIYDYQFEVIFLGAMDAMRRMLLAPLKKQFRYSEGEGLNILELGCGSGRFTYFLKIAFPKAKGGNDGLTGVGVVVHAVHKHRSGILGRGGLNHLLGAGGDVGLARLGRQEEAGAVDHQISAHFVPLQVGRFFLGGQADGLAVDLQVVAVHGDIAIKTAMHGVVLQHIGEVIRLQQVVDGDHFEAREVLGDGTEGHAADAAEAVNTYFNRHAYSPDKFLYNSPNSGQNLFDRGHNIVRREAKLLEQQRGRGRLAKAIHADDGATQTDILPPGIGHTGLDSHLVYARHQDAVLVGLVLLVEGIGTRHGHHASGDTIGSQGLLRTHGQLHLGAGGDQHNLGISGIGQHIATLGDVGDLRLGARHERQILAGENQTGRAIHLFAAGLPGHQRLGRVARTPDRHVGDHTQGRGLLDRLRGRTVVAQTDGVVGEHIDHALLHQGRHTQGIAGIFREHQEGATERQQAAMQGHAVHDVRHTKLTHAVRDVVGLFVAVDGLAVGPVGQVGTGQVSRTANALGQGGDQTLDGQLASLAGRHGLGFFQRGLHSSGNARIPVDRQLAVCATLKLSRLFREGLGVLGKLVVPQRFQAGTLGLAVPAFVHLGRNFKGGMIPADMGTGCLNLGVTQSGAMDIVSAFLVGGTLTDDGLALNH